MTPYSPTPPLLDTVYHPVPYPLHSLRPSFCLQAEKQYVLDPLSKFSESRRYHVLHHASPPYIPDTRPCYPHPPAWAGGPGYEERFYAHPDTEGPLVRTKT